MLYHRMFCERYENRVTNSSLGLLFVTSQFSIVVPDRFRSMRRGELGRVCCMDQVKHW
jgi:hypothetical protein